MKQSLGPLTLGPESHKLLVAIGKQSQTSGEELHLATEVKRGSVYSLLQRMADTGLLSGSGVPRRWSLTDRGKAVLEALMKLEEAWKT